MNKITHNDILSTVEALIDNQQHVIKELMKKTEPLSFEDIVWFRETQADLLRLVIFEKAFATGTGYDSELLEEILDYAE